jgi:hypothetical protein
VRLNRPLRELTVMYLRELSLIRLPSFEILPLVLLLRHADLDHATTYRIKLRQISVAEVILIV